MERPEVVRTWLLKGNERCVWVGRRRQLAWGGLSGWSLTCVWRGWLGQIMPAKVRSTDVIWSASYWRISSREATSDSCLKEGKKNHPSCFIGTALKGGRRHHGPTSGGLWESLKRWMVDWRLHTHSVSGRAQALRIHTHSWSWCSSALLAMCVSLQYF